MASPHLPQQMLSAANSDCGLKAEACLSPAPDALWAFPGPHCQMTSCSSLCGSLARPRDSQFIFASLCWLHGGWQKLFHLPLTLQLQPLGSGDEGRSGSGRPGWSWGLSNSNLM